MPAEFYLPIKKMKISNSIFIIIVTSFFVLSCSQKNKNAAKDTLGRPEVTSLGKFISFEKDTSSLVTFKYYTVKKELLTDEFVAPARVVASVIKNITHKDYNLILFSDPELTANFSIYLERLVNLKTYKLTLGRVQDLFENGAATGREVTEAQTQLSNEEAAIIENEAKFLLAGLEPEDILSHKAGTIWLICDIPENEIFKLQIGKTCRIHIKAYPTELFHGVVEDLGDVVDNVTRMVKLRIEAKNPEGKMKAGMFANVELGTKEGRFLCVPSNAVVTVQGKDYVFIQKSPVLFERKEVLTGQLIGEKVVIYDGIKENDVVVSEGIMQLKGLSFGF
jgi:membrane fusion protein, heavy metal efflux system